uniref:Uncharacterized protein n=1 Tax=Pararge aegeria TaxID=116150 RepID=S4NWY9_9NEOP
MPIGGGRFCMVRSSRNNPDIMPLPEFMHRPCLYSVTFLAVDTGYFRNLTFAMSILVYKDRVDYFDLTEIIVFKCELYIM